MDCRSRLVASTIRYEPRRSARLAWWHRVAMAGRGPAVWIGPGCIAAVDRHHRLELRPRREVVRALPATRNTWLDNSVDGAAGFYKYSFQSKR